MVFKSIFLFNYPILRYPHFKNFVFFYEITLQTVIYFFRMPKYAVAKGYKIGIYDTWTECEQQVKGYHKAKYKKFDSLSEAEDFIKQNSGSSEVENINVQNAGINNQHQSESFTVPQISPACLSLNGLNARLHNLEERLNTFMRETHSTLTDIQTKLVVLECQQSASTPLQLFKKESEYNEKETKGTKRPSENEDSAHCKTMKFTSGQSSRPTTSVTTSESDNEHCRYIKSEDDFVNVYTDGACANNGKLGAKAGIGVWFNKDHPLNVSEAVRGYATNNNAEIQAATKAILQASRAGVTKINIHTDSQFMIKCITSWIYKWKRNNWKLTDGGPVKNKEELICLDEAIQNMDCVKWTYVKGHSGDVGNTEADALARKGAQMYNCNVTFGSK